MTTPSSSDETEIVHGLNRFARILDRRAWDEVEQVFAPDVSFDYGDGVEQRGIAALQANFQRYLDPCGPSQHLLGSLVVTVEGDAATSRAYVQARHQGSAAKSGRFFDSNGEYVDRWQRRPEGWRITRRDVRWLIHMGDISVLSRDPSPPTETERLAAIEAIRALKARYFRCMDTKDWAGLKAVFTADVIADFRDSTPPRNEALLIVGADPYLAMLVPYLDKMTTVHQGFSPEIEITSETTATGIWAMEDILRAEEGAPVPYHDYHGYGHYHETYERQGGAWLIKTIRLSRLRVDVA